MSAAVILGLVGGLLVVAFLANRVFGLTRIPDVLVLMMIGHGTFDGTEYKFNLLGPDISGTELAALLNKIPASRQLVVNMTSASGGASPALKKEGRTVITATKAGTEKNATLFARYWVEALRDPAADTDKNETVSALEAFRYAQTKTAGFFTVAGAVSADDSVVVEDVRISERRTAGKTTRVLARLGARYVADFKERPPVNTLDVVPAGKPGAFKVFYQGEPLAKAKLELITESGWKREFKTDEQGAVEAPLPWRGTYVIEVQHTDATPGKLGEEAYDTLRCASTLSCRLAAGPQGPPMPPAATPKRP